MNPLRRSCTASSTSLPAASTSASTPCPRADPFEDDGYQGSSEYLWRAIDEHGWAEFRKDVLAVYQNEASAYELESGLVGPEQVASPMYFNQRVGGYGGLWHLSEEAEARRLERLREATQTREYKDACTAAGRELAKDPEWQESHAGRCRELAEDPAWQEANTKAARRPERCEKIRARSKNWWTNATTEQRAARVEAQIEGKRRAKEAA